MIAVVLCVVSAGAYAAGAVWQQRVAALPFRRQARHPRFWAGAVANLAGMGLHVLALRYGSLMLVQSLGVLTLVLAVAARRRPAARPEAPAAVSAAGPAFAGAVTAAGRAEAGAAVVTAAGLAGLLASLGTAGATQPVALTGDRLAWLLVASALVLGGLSVATRWPGLHTAVAGGITFGVASAVTQAVVLTWSPTAIGALCVLQPLGIWLTQLGYRRGLAAPLAAHTVANPVTAAVIGIVLLGQTVAHPLPAALCAAVAAAGIVVLAAATRDRTTATSQPIPPPPATVTLPAQPIAPTPLSDPPASHPVTSPSAPALLNGPGS